MERGVGIVGGGMMGLTTAWHLARAGVPVTVCEAEAEAGGLSGSTELLPGIRWDRYYHVILSTDDALLGLLDQIGLTPDVRFRETQTGFYTDGKLHSLSNTLDFLKFEPIGLLDKLRLGLGILYSSRIRDGRRLERQQAGRWLTHVFGKRNHDKLWAPLLRAKLGAAHEQASAAFIWAIINRYYGTRRSASKKELMGYVRGGYHTILGQLCRRIEEKGGRILTGDAVDEIRPAPGGGFDLAMRSGARLAFDRVVATVPSPELVRLWPGMPDAFRSKLLEVSYLDLVCLSLLLDRSLSPYYVTNVTDPELHFTGVIEATALISPVELNSHALVYLPRYLPPGDPFFAATDEEVKEAFLDGLRRIHPGLGERDIAAWAVHRARLVQPLQDLGYSEKIPPMRTPLQGLYLVNTTMIQDSTLNNNQVVGLAKRMAELLIAG